MQRTKKNTVVDKVDQVGWTNKGGPFYMADGTRVPGDDSADSHFFAHPREVPKAFRTTIIADDPALVRRIEEEAAEEINNVVYTVRKRGETAFFDVIDSRGKRINNKNLSEEDANKLIEQLTTTVSDE